VKSKARKKGIGRECKAKGHIGQHTTMETQGGVKLERNNKGMSGAGFGKAQAKEAEPDS